MSKKRSGIRVRVDFGEVDAGFLVVVAVALLSFAVGLLVGWCLA